MACYLFSVEHSHLASLYLLVTLWLWSLSSQNFSNQTLVLNISLPSSQTIRFSLTMSIIHSRRSLCYFSWEGLCIHGVRGVTIPFSQLCICSHQYHLKVVSFLFTVSRSMGNELSHSFWWQHRPQTQPPVTVGLQTQKSLSEAAFHGFRWPLTSIWLLVAALPMNTRVSLGHDIDHGHSHNIRW